MFSTSTSTSSCSSSINNGASTNCNSSPVYGKYSPRNVEASYFYIPECESTIVSKIPIRMNARTGNEYSKKIDIEWLPYTTPIALTYLIVAIISILYYSACFLNQYETKQISTKSLLGEAFLTRVILVEWLFVVIFLVVGLVKYRRVLMPTYIFLAIIATNGNLVLFILKVKQLIDGKIDIFDISFNLLALLLFCSIIHNIVYLYAMHLHLKTQRFPIVPIQKRPGSTFYSTIQSSHYYADNLMFTYA